MERSEFSHGLTCRLFHHVQLPDDMPGWEIALSRVTHLTLYAVIFAMTVGWAAANSRGWAVKIAGLIPLPDIAPKGSAWGHQAGDIHNILVYVLLGFIALHVAGAAWHYFIVRDRVVQRNRASSFPKVAL